jgi:LuxR family transcriptional regulator, maltose regulon positive regulatory protein
VRSSTPSAGPELTGQVATHPGTRGRPPAAAPVIAATKLHIPTPRLSMVARPALVAELAAGLGARLTLLCAPAGSGKTSLLCQWHADSQTDRPFAWISLDGADNDPGRFWDGVIAAVRTADPDFGEAAQASLHSPGMTVLDHVLPLIINDLNARGNQLILVLDDYHEIENPEIHEAIEVLIERLPGCVHLVIATRSDPPLAIGRRRVRGELTEIRADGLRFGDDEAERLLNDVLGLDLDARQVGRLQQRTEGWAAALQLAGLSLKGRSDQHEFIESFAGDDQQVVDYLGYEVLDRQPPDARALPAHCARRSLRSRMPRPCCVASSATTCS